MVVFFYLFEMVSFRKYANEHVFQVGTAFLEKKSLYQCHTMSLNPLSIKIDMLKNSQN